MTAAPWVNQTFEYLRVCGLEPALTDYSDLRRWDNWFRWERCREAHMLGLGRRTDAAGVVHYRPPLRSERTLHFLRGGSRLRSQRTFRGPKP